LDVTETGGKDTPLFRYTAYSSLIGLAIGPALFILWFYWAIVLGAISASPSKLPAVLVILLFDLALIILSAFTLSKRVWSMRFYENAFAVRARNLSKQFAYSQVKEVEHFRIFSGFQNREIITIEVEGERPFTISGNPKNSSLNIDLYRWIQSKAPGKTTSEETK
jgi:hypothetical protein